MEEEQETDEEPEYAGKLQAPSDGGRRDNNVLDRAKQASEGKHIGSDEDFYDSDGNKTYNQDGLKLDEDGNILPSQSLAYRGQNFPNSGRAFPEGRMRSVGVEL